MELEFYSGLNELGFGCLLDAGRVLWFMVVIVWTSWIRGRREEEEVQRSRKGSLEF
jgi:hypothetical protein